MSDIDTVRAVVGDPIQYDRATFIGDGVSLDFQFPNYPIVVGSDALRLGATPQTRGTDYTIDEGIGLITFVTAPANSIQGVGTCKFSLLTDDQIQAFLTLEGSADQYVKLAAADALDSMATSQALIQKKIKLLDLQTDGPALADALRKHAASLRDQVFNPDSQEPAFDVIEMIYNAYDRREKIFKDMERQGLLF